MGKTDKVIDWARARGIDSTDHDELIATLVQPEYAADWSGIIPSYISTLNESQQASIRAILGCGFHLPQLKNGQALPKHLEGFYALPTEEQEIALLHGVFDIAGAQGDTITNGSGTLIESMTRRTLDEMDILLSDEHSHLPPHERAQVAYEKILEYHSGRLGFGYDPANSDPRLRAFTRLGMMFRDATPEQMAEIPRIFDALGDVTQAHLMDFLNATGYEAEGGAVWSMYGSTLAAKFLRDMTKAGLSFDAAMGGAMRLLARINEAARRYIDVTNAPCTNVVARDLLEVAEQDWGPLLKQNIVAKKLKPGQARLFLQSPPVIAHEPEGAAQPLADIKQLDLPTENGIWIAGGGGGDAYLAAYATQITGQADPWIIATWGEPDRIRGAEPIGDSGRIFRVAPKTELVGMRQTEDLLAARGLNIALVCLDRGLTGLQLLQDDFRWVVDHTGIDPSHINFVDTGGDLLERSTLHTKRPSRDHLSFAAMMRLRREVGVVAGRTFIFVPGTDAPPYLDDIVQRTAPYIYDLRPHADVFQEQAARDGLPSADPKRYSRMIHAMWYATHPKTLAGQYAVQPLALPVSQALKRKRARPAFAAIHPQMSTALIFGHDALAREIDLRLIDLP